MSSDKQTIGKPIRRLLSARHNETLGDLGWTGAVRQIQQVRIDLRDGYREQRCGGGVRIIRKRIPE